MRNRHRPLLIYYHVYQTGGWRDMFAEQINLLFVHLMPRAHKLTIGVVGADPMPEIQWAEVIRHAGNNEEADTLRLIRDRAATLPPHYVLYLHTKGVSRQTPSTEDWRRMMEYFVVERWREALDILGDEGAVGCNLETDTFMGRFPHFSGGMWWAKSEHINALDHSYLDGPTRWHREFWIGTAPGLKCLHNSGLNRADYGGHYHEPYPRHRYARHHTKQG
jgi:hypothetical protein